MQLLERDNQAAQLSQWLGQAERSGCIALVAGEAGIGKTSLLQQFASAQRKQRVLWGACDALFTPRPLAPLHDIARQLDGTLTQLLASASDRDAIFNAMLNELDRAPSLVVFEDMHWADEATLDLVKFLGRRIHRTRSMLVMSYRDDEVSGRHPLRFVIGDLPRTSTHRLPLAALSEAAVIQLAKESDRSSKGLHALTGGNPLFVTEVLAAAPDAVPTTVSDVVLARVSRLSADARGLAEIVSVIPNKADHWLINELSPADSSIESCLDIGMVRHADGGLSFRHELTRRALQDSLSQVRLLSLHARVLEMLIKRGNTPAARLAHHADGACDASSVLKFAPLAAQEAAAVGAHCEAACFYMIALEYGEGLPAKERANLLERRSYECYLTDQIERAIEARSDALAIWRDTEELRKQGDTLRWLSRLSWFAGRREVAERYADEAIAVLERLPVGPELAMAYSNRAQLDMLANASSSAVQWAQRAIELAQGLDNKEILSHALNNLGTARVGLGEYAGWEDLERSLRIALELGLHEHAARAYTNLASTSVSARRYGAALHWLNEGIHYCEQRDLDSWFAYMRAWRARARFEQGDWIEAADDAQAVVRDPHTAPISRIPALIVLAHVRVRRGDPDVVSPLRQVRELVSQVNELQRIGPLAAVQAEAAWLADDHQTLIRDIRPAYELACARADAWTQGELAAWLWRVDALDEMPSHIAAPYSSEIAGEWRTAARLWEELGCPYEHACMLAWYGEEAERLQALTIFERLGADPAAQRLRKVLRAQGVRGIPRGVRPSTRSHEYGLTKREAQIMELLAQGMRNAAIAKRLFLSTKTVDHHVSAILNKLGVPSRTEAIAMARSTAKAK